MKAMCASHGKAGDALRVANEMNKAEEDAMKAQLDTASADLIKAQTDLTKAQADLAAKDADLVKANAEIESDLGAWSATFDKSHTAFMAMMGAVEALQNCTTTAVSPYSGCAKEWATWEAATAAYDNAAAEDSGAPSTLENAKGQDNAAEGEDATHDAAVLAWQRWSSLRDPERFPAWFQRILVNVCRDRMRRRHLRQVVSEPADLRGPDPFAGSAERAALRQALDRLTPDHRTVIVLRYDADLSVDEIAERTGERAGTVKSRLHYALSSLRAAYDAADRLPVEVVR